MPSWAQRTARWTARTLSFPFSRLGGRDLTASASASAALAAGDRNPYLPMHARMAVAPARGRHAAASPRRMR
jgi:hypothetical protein